MSIEGKSNIFHSKTTPGLLTFTLFHCGGRAVSIFCQPPFGERLQYTKHFWKSDFLPDCVFWKSVSMKCLVFTVKNKTLFIFNFVVLQLFFVVPVKFQVGIKNLFSDFEQIFASIKTLLENTEKPQIIVTNFHKTS